MLCSSNDCIYLINPDTSISHCCESCKINANKHDQLCQAIEYNDRIPKQIFMCDKTLKYITIYSENWKKLNPEYEIILYDDEMCKEFILTKFSQKHLDVFNFLKDGPIKADFWRVCILYKLGGLYIDADAEPLVPLRDYIDPTADFVTCSSYCLTKKFNPNFIMAKPGDEIIKCCIDEYMKIYDEKKEYSYWNYSIMTIFNKLLDLENYRKISGIYYDNEGKTHQILVEVQAIKYINDYNEYKGIKVFNNRYKNYDYLTHSFRE